MRQAERCGRGGGDDGRFLVRGDDGGERTGAGVIDDLGDTVLAVRQIDGHRAAARQRLQRLALVGADGDLDSEATRRVEKIAYSIGRRGREQQHAARSSDAPAQRPAS